MPFINLNGTNSSSENQKPITRELLESFIKKVNESNCNPDGLVKEHTEWQVCAERCGFNLSDIDKLGSMNSIDYGKGIEWKLKDDIKKEWKLDIGVLRFSKGKFNLI